ncbi:MAG: diaminopimelate epimerase [Eubacterium sp.]|nr:diaminopimelate epimerase [Eubacterium sp.]
MKFTKMHGCGNDYIYVNCFEETIIDFNETARKVSDRHFGIGSDGLIAICPSDVADCKMRMFNSDGSEGKMCGNAIRCVAKYVYDNKLVDKTTITVDTLSGIKTLILHVENDKVQSVVVDMGEPILNPEVIPMAIPNHAEPTAINVPIQIELDGQIYDYEITGISMGNPHGVVFVDDVHALDLEKIGPLFEHHPYFPDRVNTEFVHVIDRQNIDMRVWERGSGETLACGTGSCASVVACIVNGYTDDKVIVHLLGGDLEIEYDRAHNTVFMTGPATTICTGEIDV